ncbi:hypothetical protein [Pantoea stewartii]|uniref:hypothetical protein n=1 Tax=Pantoea stewartii TaxID=66269 RepID=UPI00345BAF49
MTEFLSKVFELIYSEKDFSINIAIFSSGITALTCYLILHDNIITLFAFVITFPVIKIIAGAFYQHFLTVKGTAMAERRLAAIYASLSYSEKEVITHFIELGTAVMTWGQMNQLEEPQKGVESLKSRSLLSASVTADGMRETFELDLTLYDYANRNRDNQR